MIPQTNLPQGATLLLDGDTWDLVIDADANIAVAVAPYATAQDAASSARTFRGECWYDSSRGVPYFERVLGRPTSLAFIRAAIVAEAGRIPNVAAARALFTALDKTTRTLSGQLQVAVGQSVVALTF